MHVFAAEAVRGVRGPIRASPARWISHPIEKPERRRDKGVSVVRENALQQQTRVLRKPRVLKP
jgi:hypothetical protein